MVRGNVFNADYAGKSKEDILTTKGLKGRGNSLSRSWKRAGINLIKEETSSSKRLKNLKYLACDIRGHTLPNYCYLFKCKRPKGFNNKGIYIKEVCKKVEYNKDLAACHGVSRDCPRHALRWTRSFPFLI